MSHSTNRWPVAGLLASWLFCPSAFAQSSFSPPVRTVEPKDDAAQEPGFVQFRQDVRRAAAECSETSLRRILAPTAPRNDFHMPPSRAFWRSWREDEDGLPGLCRILDRAIVLGGVSYGDRVYCVPYFSCAGGAPTELEELGVYLVGVVERVEIRARPSAMAAVVAHARYPVLIDCRGPYERCGRSLEDPPEGWWLARVDRTIGYVADAQVRHQLEPRLIVRRLPVGWRITAMEFYD